MTDKISDYRSPINRDAICEGKHKAIPTYNNNKFIAIVTRA